jgi:SAM-dependent methyltransferase
MAYWGYYPLMRDHLENYQYPKVLEVGVDKGQILIPMLQFLSMNFDNFHLIGNDIYARDELKVKLELMTMNLKKNQTFDMAMASSLEFLPKFVETMQGTPYEKEGYFNLMLIDGDHNYHTVKKEFENIPKLLAPGGLVIFDDYDGRWSNQDEFFIEREGYADNPMALSREEGTESTKGIKPAVDEFLAANPEWVMTKLPHLAHAEPVLIYRKGELVLRHLDEDINK